MTKFDRAVVRRGREGEGDGERRASIIKERPRTFVRGSECFGVDAPLQFRDLVACRVAELGVMKQDRKLVDR